MYWWWYGNRYHYRKGGLMLNINRDNDAIFTLTIDQKDRPLNVINENFLTTLESMVEEIIKDQDAKGLILTSSRPEFIVGADLAFVTKIDDPAECMRLTAKLHSILRSFETWGKPVVAAINGTALGGGFEVCLACHHRIAIDHPKTKIGLPEVQLGLLPGGGGTQRLPRMLGIEKALPLLLQGRTLNPQKALAAGLIDQLANDRAELIEKSRDYILQNPEASRPWDKKGFRLPGGAVQSPKGYQVIPAATAMLNAKTYGNYPAPLNILKAVYEGCQVDFDTALDIESRYFTQLVLSKESELMIRSLFYGMNECNKLENSLILYTIVETKLAKYISSISEKNNVPCFGILGNLILSFSKLLNQKAIHKPSAQHVLDEDYYDRIEAIQFTMAHDDGKKVDDINNADVILLGVSRTSKTPTSIYLANRGFKTVNIPLVMDQKIPNGLTENKKSCIVGLIADPERLADIRRNRVAIMKDHNLKEYTDLKFIKEEVENSKKLFKKNNWPVIDVTRRSVEETAASILKIIEIKKNK